MIIPQILSDFYYTTGLAARFFDENLILIDKKGVENNQINDISLPHIHTINSNQLYSLVNEENEHFIIFSFNEISFQFGYFVVGPYQSKNPEETSYRPSHIKEYYEEIMVSIIKRNIANTVGTNPHIDKSIAYINKNYASPINLPSICEHLHINMCYFCVLFKEETKLTFSQYLNKVRINQSKHLLETTTNSIIDISLSVGFNNHNHFSATFKKLTGITPTEYRNQIKNSICHLND